MKKINLLMLPPFDIYIDTMTTYIICEQNLFNSYFFVI